MVLEIFTTLIFGFCAASVPNPHDDDYVVALGHVEGDKCHVEIYVDSDVSSIVGTDGAGRSYTLEVDVDPRGGGHLTIDGQAFDIPAVERL